MQDGLDRTLTINLSTPELIIDWALDFMHDSLYYGKPFRTLNVIDESNREVLAIEIEIGRAHV